MRRSRSSTPWFLLWLVLLGLTLRPFEPVQRALAFLTLPLRFVGELGLPLAALDRGRVAAAERRLERAAEGAEEANRRLLLDLAQSSLPTEAALLVGRRAVHAEVLGRDPQNADLLRVRVRDVRGLAAGQPVACGNAYVGRLRDVSPAGIARVDLVTGADFHIGARVAEPRRTRDEERGGEVVMTVGGLAGSTGRRAEGGGLAPIRLAVHNPSDRALAGGLARVRELYGEEHELGELAEGLRLGEVVREGNGWAVVPELDYKDGLFHVVILCPPDPLLGTNVPFDPVLRDENWLPARSLGVGDPSPFRSTRKLRIGTRDGVQAGAAVIAVGAQLVGRVSRAGPWTSDLSHPDDPGFGVVAVGRIEGVAEPRVLGRLVSLGRDPEERVTRFRWIVRVDLGLAEEAASGPRPTRLFTGSGDPGLPAGLSLGTTALPLDARPGDERILEVRTEVDPRDVRRLYVRREVAATSVAEALLGEELVR